MKVIKVEQKVIEKMKVFYQNYITERIPQGGVFLAKKHGCTITAYRSGKVMFQGRNVEEEASQWERENSPMKPSTPKMDSLPEGFASESVIGSDEVGTGDYFGPLVVVAAYVDGAQVPLLEELGVEDSKKLSDKKISEIAKQLATFLPYSLLVLKNEKYNKLWAQGINQNKMKAILHNQAIWNTKEKVDTKATPKILVDEFCKPTLYYQYLKGEHHVVRNNIYFSTQGEGKHVAVAAASMIARYAFISHFTQLEKMVGMTLPKGAGKQVDKVAAQLMKKHGDGVLNRVAKVHFANTSKAQKLLNR